MKIIAVTQRLADTAEYTETRQCLDIKWGEFLSFCGFLPVILPYEHEIEPFFNTFNIDGVLLTGGNDLFSIDKSRLSKIRCDFESKLLKLAENRDIPVLGVCRGMQFIAEYYGCEIKPVAGHVRQNHKLTAPEGRFSGILKSYNSVNSYHGYAVGRVSDDINILAVSEDNSPEAIAHKHKKVMGIMWHPERCEPFSEADKELFNTFFHG